MMLVYPSRAGLDAWKKLGNEGWDFDTLKPYFRKFATVHSPPQAARDVVGLTYHDDSIAGDGPIDISFGDGYGLTNATWMETFSKLGLTMTADTRQGTAMGAFQQPASINPQTKTRSYAATAHYSPEIAARPNFSVITNTIVQKINFDTSGPEPVATGVVTRAEDGSEKTINGAEIILAAGALMSPQILELSGVGSKALLESLRIPVVIDNPSVGENLQDHPMACQSFEVKEGIPSSDVLRDPAILNALIGQFQAGGAGPLGQSNISVAYAPLADETGVLSHDKIKAFFAERAEHITTPDGAVLRSVVEDPDEPSIEYLLFPGQAHTVLKEPGSMADYLMPRNPENYITVMTLVHHPFSRGSVHARSADVADKPTYDPKLSANPIDLDVAASHVRFVEKLVATEPFAALLKPDGARIPNIKADTLEKAKEVVRQTQVTDFHPSGSCAMLPRDKGGVVDNRLRVYGTKGLRIVDASVFPLEPAGNLQTTVYAVAERAADIIKEDRK
jgi:choline dehydrogenase-like flavoprotein